MSHLNRRTEPKTIHPGESIGGYWGIGANTRRIVVAELRELANHLIHPDEKALVNRRADEIEEAGRVS